MMTLIEKGEQTLSRLLESSASVSVVYRRGEEAVELPATVGKVVYEIDGKFGQTLFTSRDYIVDRDLLVHSSGLIEPEKGDRIWQLIGGTTFVYEVSSPGGEIQCFDHSGETRWRIHTKFVQDL